MYLTYLTITLCRKLRYRSNKNNWLPFLYVYFLTKTQYFQVSAMVYLCFTLRGLDLWICVHNKISSINMNINRGWILQGLPGSTVSGKELSHVGCYIRSWLVCDPREDVPLQIIFPCKCQRKTYFVSARHLLENEASSQLENQLGVFCKHWIAWGSTFREWFHCIEIGNYDEDNKVECLW